MRRVIMKSLNKWLVFLFVMLFCVITPLNLDMMEANSNGSQLEKNTQHKIEDYIETTIKKSKIPGLSISVVDGSDVIYQKSFGYADLESKEPVTSKTMFEIGSNSKAFTALGILKLQKEGKIDLEEEISKYIPWLSVRYDGHQVPLTIGQLLYQTSGIPFHSIDHIPESDKDNALEETVRTLIDINLESYPGEHFQYATINYDVLGLLIEKVTGVSFERYMEDEIFHILGLGNTFLSKIEIGEGLAKGYKLAFFKPYHYEAPVYGGNRPAGYVISTLDDMTRWLKIQMSSTVVPNDMQELIEESHVLNQSNLPSDDGFYYGAGWFIRQIDEKGYRHGGNNPNYSSYIIINAEKNIGIVILANMNSDYTATMAHGVEQILNGELPDNKIVDRNNIADKIAVMLIVVLSCMIAVILFFLLKGLYEIKTKLRKVQKRGLKNIVMPLLSLMFTLFLCYLIVLLPYVFYGAVSWNFIFVWLPATVKLALILVYAVIFMVYLYIVFQYTFPKEGERSFHVILLLSLISGIGNFIIIFTINTAITSTNELRIRLILFFVFGFILYVFGQKLVRSRLIDLTNLLVYKKRTEITNSILKASYEVFERIDKGQIQSTLNNDTETISRFVNILVNGVTSAITLICCFIYLGVINSKALILAVAVIFIIAGIYFLAGKYANAIGEEARELQNEFFQYINDFTEGFKELSLNQKRKIEFEFDMNESSNQYRVKRGKAAKAFANMLVIGELLFTSAIGLIVFVFPLVLNNMETANLSSYVFVLLYINGPVHGILEAIPNAIEVRISLKKINGLMEVISGFEVRELLHIEEKEDNICIKLENIRYEYNQNDANGFNIGPLNYEFHSGEIVFIIGGNGSGKSTFAKLLTGLYTPTDGIITINDKVQTSKELSENFSAVFNDFYLFNKLYGIDIKNKEEKVKDTLKLLKLDHKVSVADGFISTTKLSTGERKRLALLVTYLEDRPICLFDEWAADQDPEFRLFFYDTLLPELKKQGKCIITITHDDYYFSRADKIVKMERTR